MQTLSGIRFGLQDETFHADKPVLVGVDAASTYCYLLESVERRDEDTWGWHLLAAMAQGFAPDYTIGDGDSELRVGQKAAMTEVPCHGDVFHIQQQFEKVANGLACQVQRVTTRRIKLEQKIVQAKMTTQKLTIQQVQANCRERGLVAHARDVEILLRRFEHDVMTIAGPTLAVRQELFDLIVVKLKQRADKPYPDICKLRTALHNQHDQLLAFAGVFDQKLDAIAIRFELPSQVIRDVCLLYRKPNTSSAYWERWNQLHSQLSGKFMASRRR